MEAAKLHRTRVVLILLVAASWSSPAEASLGTRSAPMPNRSTTAMEDPLEPIWNRLDNLSNDIVNRFQNLIEDILSSTNGKLEAKLTKLDTDVRAKLDSINNNVIHRIGQVFNNTSAGDTSLQTWLENFYHSTVRPDAEASYLKIESVIGANINALENKILEHINNKVSALMSFNLTLPSHTTAAAASSGATLSDADAQSIVSQLNAKFNLIETKVDDLSRKVNTATETLSTINTHVTKINNREMDAESAQREPGIISGGGNGAGGGGGGEGDSCRQLVSQVSQLMNTTQVARNDLETRLAEMRNSPTMLPRDCSDVHWYNPGSASGVYQIHPTLDVKWAVSAWCNMGDLSQKEEGGWTVILRRRNTTWGFVDFNRTWDDYVNGFGDPAEGEWWFSLSGLHALTYRQPYEVKFLIHDIELGAFTAQYNTFRVEDEGSHFRLIVDGFSGNISQDAFKSKHHGRAFSTWDSDNDNWDKGSCSVNNGGGWWFNACHYTTLTAPFPTSNDRDARTIRWLNGNTWLVLDDVTIEIRPANYALRYNVHSNGE